MLVLKTGNVCNCVNLSKNFFFSFFLFYKHMRDMSVRERERDTICEDEKQVGKNER